MPSQVQKGNGHVNFSINCMNTQRILGAAVHFEMIKCFSFNIVLIKIEYFDSFFNKWIMAWSKLDFHIMGTILWVIMLF